ncbi:MAG: uroporphyrinogen-III C-methyltransferase [Tannerella sp.]|jgi:uroporphyrinogen III methyltransferase/synthase|nr:uroporphyrinogen-III C-methyltransferase [Tannerella sp.]
MSHKRNKLKVVARKSPLSLVQVEEIFGSDPSLPYELIQLDSFGDKHKNISLMDPAIAGDFFTRELDDYLLEGKADMAVHSAKDLPYPLTVGLELYSLTEAKEKSDSLVSKDNLSLDELPQGARVGTSSLNRKKELLNLRPDLTVVSIRGTIGERISQVDNGYIDALIVATCALQRLGLEDRIARVLPFGTHALQGNLAIVGRKGNAELKAVFMLSDVRRNYGKVALVGFGPGNADLLTIAGDKALQNADIIFHDDLIDIAFLDKYNAQKVYAGKRRRHHSRRQDEINELVYQAAVSGKNVVRLKGGDPMIFAHGREEIDYLQSRFVEVAVIPGISSGIALAAYTHIPLTHRGVASSVSFVTGHGGCNARIPNTDTLVYYMAGAKMTDIAQKLILAGRSEDAPVALVYNVSMPDQKTIFSTLGELRFSLIKYPTPILLVVGDVVAFENGKACQNVLITGTSSEEYKGTEHFVHTPLISVRKLSKNSLNSLLEKGIASYDWIIFTSRYGVRFFFEILDEMNFDIRALTAVKIGSVGKVTTAELKKNRLYPDVESLTESAGGLVNYFKENQMRGLEILLPRSDKGLKILSDELQALGNQVTDVPVYENSVNTKAEKVELSDFQKIIFSSPSGVEAFRLLYGELPEGIQLIAKGNTTENKIKESLNSK